MTISIRHISANSPRDAYFDRERLMSAGSRPKRFVLASAIEGRLRFPGLPSPGPWDPSRLTYVTYWTAQDPGAASLQGRERIVLSVEELDHVLVISHGIPAPIHLFISDALLSHAQEKWDGSGT